jgi:hypothetical protein
MFHYISELFSSLLNINAFMREPSDVSDNESTEKLVKKEEEKEEEKEKKETEEEKKETEEEKKETYETFEFIEINDDDVEDMFITKF